MDVLLGQTPSSSRDNLFEETIVIWYPKRTATDDTGWHLVFTCKYLWTALLFWLTRGAVLFFHCHVLAMGGRQDMSFHICSIQFSGVQNALLFTTKLQDLNRICGTQRWMISTYLNRLPMNNSVTSSFLVSILDCTSKLWCLTSINHVFLELWSQWNLGDRKSPCLRYFIVLKWSFVMCTSQILNILSIYMDGKTSLVWCCFDWCRKFQGFSCPFGNRPITDPRRLNRSPREICQMALPTCRFQWRGWTL